jgi:TPR repeat protein
VNGRGVAQDFAEAARWYRKAADQGNAPGQASLGDMYAHGQGVTQDYAEAASRAARGALAARATNRISLRLGGIRVSVVRVYGTTSASVRLSPSFVIDHTPRLTIVNCPNLL